MKNHKNRSIMDGEKATAALIAMAKSGVDALPSQERVSLAVQTIRDAGFRVTFLKGAYLRNLRVAEDPLSMKVIPDFHLPTWNEVENIGGHSRIELTRLAQFIYDEEPSGKVANEWRSKLKELVLEVYQLGYLEAIRLLKEGAKP